jgi:rare lipoprotein A
MQISPLPAETPVSIPAEKASGKIYLQLGAFNSQQGAESFMQQMREKLTSTGRQLSLARKGGYVKVRIGPYASDSQARSSALELQSLLGFKPMVSVH